MKSNLTFVNNSSNKILNDVALETQKFLNTFATSKSFIASIIYILGDRTDIEKLESLHQQWLVGSFGELPIVEKRFAAEINSMYSVFSC